MADWFIHYKKGKRSEERLVFMPTVEKLLTWIEKHGSKCQEIRIYKVLGEN